MSTAATSKAWFLQYERAILCLANHPKYALGVVANLYKIKSEELQEWLNHFNGGARELTIARIHQVKIELGILSEGPSTSFGKVAIAPPETSPAPRTASVLAASDLPKPSMPWLKRGSKPRARGLASNRRTIVDLSLGGEADASPACLQFFTKWFGTRHPNAEQAKAFLKWVDSEPTAEPAPEKEKKPRKVRQPKVVQPSRKSKRRAAPAAVVVAPVLDLVPHPAGLRPRWLADEQRLDEISAAMQRYLKAGIAVPDLWILELTDLLESVKGRRSEASPRGAA